MLKHKNKMLEYVFQEIVSNTIIFIHLKSQDNHDV